jgi:hypothetical protein
MPGPLTFANLSLEVGADAPARTWSRWLEVCGREYHGIYRQLWCHDADLRGVLV